MSETNEVVDRFATPRVLVDAESRQVLDVDGAWPDDQERYSYTEFGSAAHQCLSRRDDDHRLDALSKRVVDCGSEIDVLRLSQCGEQDRVAVIPRSLVDGGDGAGGPKQKRPDRDDADQSGVLGDKGTGGAVAAVSQCVNRLEHVLLRCRPDAGMSVDHP